MRHAMGICSSNASLDAYPAGRFLSLASQPSGQMSYADVPGCLPFQT